MPESPRWLAKMGRNHEAKLVIEKLYEPEFKNLKFTELQHEAEKLKIETSMTEKERLKSLFSTYSRCLIIGCGVQAA
jgi:hypothetical protein